jgi:hypothetical protein
MALNEQMEIETRQAALCVFPRGNAFLVSEISDPVTGAVLHRPPGGGIEEGESPEQAVRRTLRLIGNLDHIWSWKGRELHERAWLFWANSSDDERLSRGETPDLVEADGERVKTLWRSIDDAPEALPPLCPTRLIELLSQFAHPD